MILNFVELLFKVDSWEPKMLKHVAWQEVVVQFPYQYVQCDNAIIVILVVQGPNSNLICEKQLHQWE